MVEPAKPRDTWLLPSIGGIVALAALLVPVTCNASVGDTQYVGGHGGAIMGGATAILLAAIALGRGRTLGGPGVFALVVAAGGAAILAFGVLTMHRVPSASETADLDGPVRRVFEAMRDEHFDRIPGAGDATAEQMAEIRALAHGWARGLGRWQDISGLETKPGDGDTAIATGTARYERGTPRFALTFRFVAGAPLLSHFDLTIPPDQLPPVADAEKAARQLAADIMAGAIDRVHDDLDPRMGPIGSIETAIPQIHAHVAPSGVIELVSHTHCDVSECFELHIPLTGGTQRVRVTESDTFGIWLASSIALGNG